MRFVPASVMRWLIGMAVIAGLSWAVYAVILINDCWGGNSSRDSIRAAAALGGTLWLAAAALSCFDSAGRLGGIFASLIFAGLVVLYILGLIGLWKLTPVFWGPMYCPAH